MINPQRVRGSRASGDDSQLKIRHGEMDIVVDNPPFTRVGANNSASDPDVPNTVFGDQDPLVAKQMRQALLGIEDTIGNLSAGFGSYFVDLADRI